VCFAADYVFVDQVKVLIDSLFRLVDVPLSVVVRDSNVK
jgi:hypothetical protein